MNRIGVDIGGTKIACAAFNAAGEIVHDQRIATPKDYSAIIAAVAQLVKAAGEGTVGIGAPGSLGPRDGPHEPLWRNCNITICNGKPLFTDLQTAIGRAIRMDNDANCFALSEAIDGAGKGHASVVFYTIGTGLGGGIVIDGKIIRGANGEAAEFGHTGLPWMDEADWPPIPCFCGKRGCTEMYVSGTGFVNDYARATGEKLSGPEVIARARSGEPAANAVLKRLQDRFARVVANLVNVLDPDIVVMGGGMASLPELVEELPAIVSRYSFSGAAKVKIARAAFGDASGVRGAALLWPA